MRKRTGRPPKAAGRASLAREVEQLRESFERVDHARLAKQELRAVQEAEGAADTVTLLHQFMRGQRGCMKCGKTAVELVERSPNAVFDDPRNIGSWRFVTEGTAKQHAFCTSPDNTFIPVYRRARG